MPKKTITTKVAIGVHDPERDTPEVKDATGNVLQPYSRGLGHASPGTPVTLDADEADRIIARWGGEVLEEIPDDVTADDVAATGAKTATKPAKPAAA